MSYTALDPDAIIETLELLSKRTRERFPTADLADVCHEVTSTAREAKAHSGEWAEPILSIRVGAAFLICVVVVVSAAALANTKMPTNQLTLLQFTGFVEAALNDLVLIGACLFFLGSLEARLKRRRALLFVRKLRALAHIVDMHQLTKGAERLLPADARTISSPVFEMTGFQMRRYLDYCSELLALIGKIAAFCVQGFDDAVVLSSIDEIEGLVTGLQHKIWQKVLILHQVEADGSARRSSLQ